MKRVEVDAVALREVLQALIGPDYRIRELQATRSLERLGAEFRNPINVLVRDYDSEFAAWQSAPRFRTCAVQAFASQRTAGDGPFPPPQLELVTGRFPGCHLRVRSFETGQEQTLEVSGATVEQLSKDLLGLAERPQRQSERVSSAGLFLQAYPEGTVGKVVNVWLEPPPGAQAAVARLSPDSVRALAAQLQQVAQRDAPKAAAPVQSEMSLGG